MRHAYRFAPRIALALAIAGLTLIGWVARSTRAQDGARPGAEEPKLSAPGPPAATPVQDAAPVLKDGPMPSEPGLPPVRDGGVTTEAPAAAVPANDDPEQNARAFVERNRKEARDELKKLEEEAQRLRTRLGKVEAGIRRWEALLTSLDNSERIDPPVNLRPLSNDHPTQLEPAPIAAGAQPVRESAPGPIGPVAPSASLPSETGPR